MTRQTSELNLVTDLEKASSEISCEVRDFPPRISNLPLHPEPSPQDMSITALADRCMKEMDNFRCGEPSHDQYGVELFRRALVKRDALAWEAVQQRFNELVHSWMCCHPMRKAAIRHDSEENYVAQAFARFWQAAASNQNIEFMTLSAVLRYLRASLNGAILDTLRSYSRPHLMQLPEPGSLGEPLAEAQDDGHELWETVQSIIPDERQQRVAYLLFYCHLKPREIVRFCPEEFSDVGEIYRLRRNIFERLFRNIDYIRWRFSH